MQYPLPPSSVIQSNIDALTQREELGRIKYGQDLDRTDLSHTDLLQHAREEMLDGANYLAAAVQRLTNTEAKYLDLRERLEKYIALDSNRTTRQNEDLYTEVGHVAPALRRMLDEHDTRMVITGNYSR